MTTPTWTTAPPPQAWADTITAAQHAAEGDPLQCCATIAESRCDPGWLVIAGVSLLAAALAEGVAADELRAEVLRIATDTGASDYMVTASLEVVALAEAMQRDELPTIYQLCSGSQVSARDLAHGACSLTGQSIAAVAVDVGGVFDRLRAQYGGY
ncbi:hypothetical protein [Mycolicibacterium sp. OfavD-34-C]|uniref:hypothetical protein n=1 Tax=Mycolicibacterium sp. OfavD-34-C TaxID=2917746 RepID=UPI001EF660B7|nr:hypothetical protein [Mycolicibacterium sp. OfavD-34-C]MCG7583675.1 hypothetical protein [Mycolicibacterium sp. OfavD-34-C]